MKQFKLFFYAVLSLLVFSTCGGDDDTVNNGSGGEESDIISKPVPGNSNANIATKTTAYLSRLDFPKVKGGNSIIIVHRASFGINYSVEWDTDKHAQRWSCYRMHAGNSSGMTNRKPYEYNGAFSEYPNDPDLPAQYRFTVDPYSGSGYDHGHIMPSADRAYGYNQTANRQTFYMTNMQPQLNGFNAKVWANMEQQVRNWNKASFRDTLYVVKGGTIDAANNIIKYLGAAQNKIPVPKYFFMAILCKNARGYKAIGFWIEHKANSDTSLKKYVVNIDELEKKTGIDFFCNLPDNIENAVESVSASQLITNFEVK